MILEHEDLICEIKLSAVMLLFSAVAVSQVIGATKGVFENSAAGQFHIGYPSVSIIN